MPGWWRKAMLGTTNLQAVKQGAMHRYKRKQKPHGAGCGACPSRNNPSNFAASMALATMALPPQIWGEQGEIHIKNESCPSRFFGLNCQKHP
jgi:hypothetical protein